MTDLVIVGGGIAGLCAALRAPADAGIVVIDKGEAGAGSSPLAQGGMAAAVGPGDSVDLHARDTLAAGVGLCDPAVVADICAAGPEAVEWLVSLGCAFDLATTGGLDLAREGGQSAARSVHRADATGGEIVRALRHAVRGRNVERIPARATGLLVAGGRCVGVAGEHGVTLARTTLLATGGAGGLWGRSTNAPGATGDGLVLALAAGVTLADLEFMQFHPTALAIGDAQRVLLTEALRGDGALLVDAAGERFVDELAPRHIVAKAILDAGDAYLDCRSVADVHARFPTVTAGARAFGLDPATDLLPVSPAAHYFIGGVRADAYGRTSMPGLFAAGECAASGMHGANRLAGNSLLETVVVGGRVGARAMDGPDPVAGDLVRAALDLDGTLASVMWSGGGPIRDAAGLRRARATIAERTGRVASHADLCLRIVDAALARTESRGVHVRADFPDVDPALAARAFDRPTVVVRD